MDIEQLQDAFQSLTSVEQRLFLKSHLRGTQGRYWYFSSDARKGCRNRRDYVRTSLRPQHDDF